jgi:hypothetical protein
VDSSSDEEYMELGDSDICQLCKRPWLSSSDVKQLDHFFQLSQQKETATCSISSEEDIRKQQFTNLRSLNLLRETLIICEGCEGCFHVLCVGLTAVPKDDWYCTWCIHSAAEVN